jgi:hypothetical protein
MKFSNLSNKVRWILAVIASLTVVFAGVFAASQSPDLENGLWAFFCFIAAFLTGVTVAPLHGKRFIIIMAVLFILSCLIPPWRNPARYSLLFDTSTGVQIDFGRLFLEWAALAAVTGMVWLLVVKPAWLRK